MNNINTPSFKGKKYLRFAAWFVAVVASVLAIAYVGINEFARYSMQALNRETLSVVEFDEYMSEILSEPLYTPDPSKPFSPVYFKLDLGLMGSEDTLVNIYSHTVDKRVYRGTYQKEFTIQAGEELLGANSGDGGDNFSINIIQKSTRKIGTGVVESIRPWQANKTVHITLLPFRELNAIGLPETFKVHVD